MDGWLGICGVEGMWVMFGLFLTVLQTSTDSIYITTETRVVLEDLLWFT